MSTTLYILAIVMALMMGFLIVSFIYSLTIVYKQSKRFINNLTIGDETNYGKISGIDGDYVIINHEPLRIHRSEIQPKEFRANKHLFLFGRTKN